MTSYQPTLVSSAEKVVLEAMETIAAAPGQAQRRILGIHLEGPFIDPVTHLHNAQRRFAAGDPGIAAVAMTRGDATVGVIADLVHLASETVLLAFLAARDRVTIVTDAIAAAPSAEGRFTLGDRPIVVSDGAARLEDGTLAGSVLSMDRTVRNLVHIGIPWSVAVSAATALPARLIGRPELGTLRPGTPADIVVLDDALRVTRTIAAGQVAWAA